MITNLRAAVACTLLAAALASCSRDPAAAKQEYLKRGQAFAAEKKYREATIEYQNALRVDPLFGEAHLGLGEAYVALGDKARALQSFVRAADAMPNNDDVLLRAGSMRLFARQYEDAKVLADKVIARQPKNLVALMLRANALAGLNDVSTAIQEIEEAIQLEPERGELYANLGSVQQREGKLKEAEAAFKQAVAVAPSSAQAHSALANFYWSTQRPQEAEKSFLKAVELEPTDLLANRALATFYVASGRPLEAERFLKAVADVSGTVDARVSLADYYLLTRRKDQGVQILKEVAKDNREGAFTTATTRLAAEAYAEGRRQDAHALLDQVLGRSPNDARGLLLLARFLSLEKKPDEALASAQKAVKADPQFVPAQYFLGRLHLAKGNNKEAAAAFRTVLDLNPKAAGAQFQLSRLSLAAGNPDAAVALAEAAVKNAGGDPSARLALVRALLTRGDLTRASSELVQLRKAYPKSAPVLALTGNLHLQKKDYAAARVAYEAAFKEDPGSLDSLSGLIALDLVAGRPAAARARIEAAVAKDPRRAALLLLAARTYAATQDLTKAESALRTAISVDPSNLEAYGTLGQFYYQRGRLDDGRQEFEKVVAQQPDSVAGQTMLGIILKRQGRTEEAVQRYERALAADPQTAVAANNLAWILAEEGRDLDRARSLAQVAIRQLPDEPDVADTLGWVYFRKNLPELGIPFLKEAVDRRPKNPAYRYHLGAAYLLGGDLQKAEAELQLALKLSSTFEGADETRRLLATIK